MAEETALNLKPNAADMARHLELLFGNAREYEDGLIEIAVNTGKGWLGQLFAIDEIHEAVEFARTRNAQRCNVYVGIALRDPEVPLIGRCNDGDHYATTTVGGDLDTAEASAAAPARTRALPPSFIVCTGQHPHTRLQPFWSLTEAVTDPDQHRALFGGIADSLDGDRAVTNPSRVMRLAGSIAWPTKPGRVAELTSLVPLKYGHRTYTAEEIARAYPASDKVHAISTHKNDPIERVGAKNSLGLDTGKLEDGREDYLRRTLYAVLMEYVGTHGATPTEQELFDLVWPQYERGAVTQGPGLKPRGQAEVAAKCRSTLRRLETRGLSDGRGKRVGLQDMVKDYAAKKERASEKPAQDYAEAAGKTHDSTSSHASEGQKRIAAAPFRLTAQNLIPMRAWVYGRHLIRRFVSATVAPGGVGKSSLSFVEAMAMVTAKPLLGVNVPQPLKVWVWCLEDPREELDRRFAAIAKHYGITDEDIGGRLFLNSGRDTPLCVARQESKTGTIIIEPDMAQIEAEIVDLGVDVLIVDPFVASHMVSENDNVAINAVMRQWVLLAERCNVAIELIHHTRKNGDGEVTAETSRGAKALTDATRDTRVINQMSEAEGAKFGLENRRLYFRTYSDKANLAPPAERSDWYKLEDVALSNGPMGADGDHVGVATRWEIPGPFDKIDRATIDAILTAINLGVIGQDGNQTGTPYGDSKRGRSNSRWVGQVIMDHTGMEEEEAKRAITAWVQSGVLIVEEIEINRRATKGIRVNREAWAEMVGRHQ